MDIFAFAEKIMSMDDAAWERHANPLSGYTRFTALPLIVLAIWSRVWLGWWCLIPLAAALLWTWLNPRLFSAPRSTNNWASKGTFGERTFLRRKEEPIPKHHEVMALRLAAASAPGVMILIYSLVVLDFWAVICGLFISMLPKLWFVDRMVWLYEDMKDTKSEYRSWLR